MPHGVIIIVAEWLQVIASLEALGNMERFKQVRGASMLACLHESIFHKILGHNAVV